MSRAVAAEPDSAAQLSLGLFIYPHTYRVIAAARSRRDDLVVVVTGTAVATLLELLLNHAHVSKTAASDIDPIGHAALVLHAQMWYPAVAAGFVLLVCLRLSAHVGPDPSMRRFLALSLAGAAAFAVAAFRLDEVPGPWAARFGPLIVALLCLPVVWRWRRRRQLRRPTAAGLRPPLRALLTPRGFVALRNLSIGIPRAAIVTTDIVDSVLMSATTTFCRRGDYASAAYAHACAVEHELARGQLVNAEARLAHACTSDQLREQPAVMCVQAMLLAEVGRFDDAIELLTQAERRLAPSPPLGLRSLLAHARLRAGHSAVVAGKVHREWALLTYRGRPGTVLVELVGRLDAAWPNNPEAVLQLAHRVLEVVNAVRANPLVELELDELERVEEAGAQALLTIARICQEGSSQESAAEAYLDAIPAFQFVKDRARTAECLVCASALLLANARGSAEQESHALDLMRAAFELVESQRGGLRGASSRSAFVRDQRRLFGVAFRALATDLHWLPDKGGELALWLMESLHRTTLGAVARSRIVTSDAELQVRLETLARVESAQLSPTDLTASRTAGHEPLQLHAPTDADAVSVARKAVIAQFARARDTALAVDSVSVETLRAKLGVAVALLYHCSRDPGGWTVSCVVVHPKGELVFRGKVEAGGRDSPGDLLDVIAEKRHDAISRAFARPMWERPWDGLADGILPPLLTEVLEDSGNGAPDLVIVPDGPLAAVPFVGLKLADGRTLLEAARVRMVPALSLIEDERESPGRGHATIVVTHLDDHNRSVTSEVRIPPVALERATGTRSQFEEALRSEPAPDLAVILAHGEAGDTPYDDVVLLADSAMSAAAAMQLPWPPAVLLGSCWLGGSDVAVGSDPFGFPIACLMNGAKTVVGALSPVGRRDVRELLTRVAAELPTASTLGEVVRRAIVPTDLEELEGWREATAMEWPCLTTWSTVSLAEAPGRVVRPGVWDGRGLPQGETVVASASTDVRVNLPLAPGARTIFESEAGRSRRGVVALTGLLRGACSTDPVCSGLPGAADMGAAASAAPIDAEVPDRVLRLDAGTLPIYVTRGVATSLEVADTMARALDVVDVPMPLIALTSTFDDRTEKRVAQHPPAQRFIDALMDLLERDYEIARLLNNAATYDGVLAARMQNQPGRAAPDLLRYTRRVGWGVAAVALTLIGSGLSDAARLQLELVGRGFLGVELGPGPYVAPEVLGVLAGSSAERSGLRVGDEIESIDELHVATKQEALDLIRSHHPGEVIRLTALRDGKRLVITARLARLP